MSGREPIGKGGTMVLVAGIVGLLVFVVAYERAFPTAAIELTIDRAAASERAQSFLLERGYDVRSYRRSVTFGSNGDAAVFLQRVLSDDLEATNRELATRPIWRWQARWFRSGEKEEFRVHLSPAGEVLHFEHRVPEAAGGADLELDGARPLAVDCLRSIAGVDPDMLDEVQASTKRLEQRTDHTFEWERRDYELRWLDEPEAGTGNLRYRVVVQGDAIGAFEYYYKVPERFTREFARQQSQGTLLAILSFLLMFVTGLAAFVVFVIGMRRGVVRWRLGLGFGVVSFAAFVAQALNTLPVLEAAYETRISYEVYLAMVVAAQAIIGLVFASLILACTAAGEATMREFIPGAVRSLATGASAGLTRATVFGYGFAFIFLGYVTLFYLVGRRYFGVWLPAEGPYAQVLSTALPFLTPLLISVWAAVSEEATFRLFAVPFLRKVTGRWWLALFIPSLIWAFAHSTYAVFPVWVRGIELTIAGIAFGMLFIRVDIVAAIIAHYVVDAVFISTPLLTSGNRGYVVSGAVVISLALVPALVAFLRSRAPTSRSS